MGSKTEHGKLVVIGAGPAGYVAAFHAADLGLEVTLIDPEAKPGGVCLFRGCIPSKALIHAREMLGDAHAASEMGIKFGDPEIDVDQLRAWKDGVIEKLTGGLMQLAKTRKVRYLQATATFKDAHTLSLEPVEDDADVPSELSFDNAIIATGSRPFVPGPLQVEHPRVMGSREALNLPDIPERLLVVGGGYIGLELGQVYEGLGSKVTVVEMLDRLLPNTDASLVKPLVQRLKQTFEGVHLKTQVEKLEPQDDKVIAHLKDENDETRTEEFDRVLVSVGRKPHTDGLGLENTDVQINERGCIVTDKRMRTDEDHVFAIGDVVGGWMLAHEGSYEGKIAAEVIAGKNEAAYDANCVPAVIFSDPEVAYCGLTEMQAEKEGIDFEQGRFPWGASGRAIILGQTKGFTRVLTEPDTGRVLGVGMVGRGSGDLISEGVLAVEMSAVAEDIAWTIHPHPTLSETLMEAAEAAVGKAIHSA